MGGSWRCPLCDWAVVDHRPYDEQVRLVADGWWWCAQDHKKVPVEWKSDEELLPAALGDSPEGI